MMLIQFWKNYKPFDFHPADKQYFERNKHSKDIVNASFRQVREEFGNNLKSNKVNNKFKQKIKRKILLVKF